MMTNNKLIYLNLVIISATVLCFEIISTRISSVIFVNNYAFIILSLAILGLAAGGIYSYYKIKIEPAKTFSLLFNSLMLAGGSLVLFITCITLLKITNPFLYFFLQSLPFFFFGIIYAQVFKNFAVNSFNIYASDLAGAALGSVVPLFIINLLGAPNSILFLAVLIFCFAGINVIKQAAIKRILFFYSFVSAFLIFLIINGDNNFLGRVPIGNYDEKDFHYVYPNAGEISQIVESRWSIYGRSDLVQYDNQDEVKQLFVDGAAGSQMYRFNGDIINPGQLLINILVVQSSSIPFLFLSEKEKNNMLVIGPGGGKEVLIGLLGGVEQITGVEINPDFVNIVKDYSDFNGGIYRDFQNVQINVGEGRRYIRKTDEHFDLIMMALPSTEQLQNIDNFAMNENYLLTVEAIQDYLKTLTPEGRLIFTVHNNWELLRLLITSMKAFNNIGINNQNALDHFLILEHEYTPTIVIKKNPFTVDEIVRIENINKTIPQELSYFSYLPYHWRELKYSLINNFLNELKQGRITFNKYIEQNQYNITPCRDDNPYFYKIEKGILKEYLWLLIGVVCFNLLLISIPYIRIRKKVKKNSSSNIIFPILIFIFIGIGFMIIEISLFQKLILFLGSPTTSLSVLLSSLLIGMGIGSFFGKRIFRNDIIKRLHYSLSAIVIAGILLFIMSPFLLNKLLEYNLFISSIVCFVIILPLGFVLGIPFPTAIQYLKQKNMDEYIPWMYGINGGMSVLGSVIAINFSMLFGFAVTFFFGLSVYAILFIIILLKKRLKLSIV